MDITAFQNCLDQVISTALEINHNPICAVENVLWVIGLGADTKAAQLKVLFSQHGRVAGAKIVTNAKNPHRCFGFLEMASAHDADVCIERLNGFAWNGRELTVERPKPGTVPARLAAQAAHASHSPSAGPTDAATSGTAAGEQGASSAEQVTSSGDQGAGGEHGAAKSGPPSADGSEFEASVASTCETELLPEQDSTMDTTHAEMTGESHALTTQGAEGSTTEHAHGDAPSEQSNLVAGEKGSTCTHLYNEKKDIGIHWHGQTPTGGGGGQPGHTSAQGA